MKLTPPEKKLLRAMKSVQESLDLFVIVDSSRRELIRCGGYYLEQVDAAYKSSEHVKKIPYPSIIIDHALANLIGYGLIKKPSSGPACQVTYKGWYNDYVLKREMLDSLITNIFFPAIVSFITTLITLLIRSYMP